MKYWENEQPITASTKRNVFKLFKNADKLQVSNPNWTNDDGQEKQGKTVTIDLEALRAVPEALELMRQALTE